MTLLNKIKKNPLLILILLIVITDVLIFFPFLNGTYVYQWKGWGYDTYHSYVPSHELISRMLQEHQFSSMSFEYGFGEDLIDLIQVVNNPISLLIILISYILKNENIIPNLMVLFPVLVSVISGINIYCFLRNKIRSSHALVIGSYLYAFSGYLVSTGTHYWFSSYLIFFPLLLLSVDLCFDKKEMMFFYFAVLGVVIFATAYAAFPMLLVVGMYMIYKTLDDSKFDLKIWLSMIGTAILAVLSTSFLFIPFVYKALYVSNRVDDVPLLTKIISSFSIISKEMMSSAFLKLFSNNLQGGVDSFDFLLTSGAWFSCFPWFFSILFPLLFMQYIFFVFRYYKGKNKIVRLFYLIIMFIMMFTNCFVELFQIYTTKEWRMAFIFLPFWAWIVSFVIEKMLDDMKFNHLVNIISVIIFSIMLFLLKDKGYITNDLIFLKVIICLFLMGVILEIVNIRKLHSLKVYHNLCFLLLVCVIFINYYYDHRYSIIWGASPISYNENYEYYTDRPIDKLVEEIDKNVFFRVEKTYLYNSAEALWSMTNDCRSVSTYDSLLNKNIPEYFYNIIDIGQPRRTLVNFVSFARGDYDTYYDVARMSLLGIKYLVSTEDRDLSEWKKIDTIDGYYIYENKFIESAGQIFDNWISEDEYEKLSVEEKSVVENQSIIIETSALSKNEKKLGYYSNILQPDQIEINDADCISQKDDILDVKMTSESEIDINISNLKKKNGARYVLSFDLESYIPTQIEISHIAGKSIRKENYVIDAGENKFPVLLEEDTEKIIVKSVDETEYIFNKIEYIESPIAFKTNCFFENKKAGNVVKGTVETEQDAFLFMPIVYQKGWEAYVDGESVQIEKANFAFSAIRIPSGKHDVKFSYKNHVFTISLYISLLSILVTLMLFFIKKEKSKL